MYQLHTQPCKITPSKTGTMMVDSHHESVTAELVSLVALALLDPLSTPRTPWGSVGAPSEPVRVELLELGVLVGDEDGLAEGLSGLEDGLAEGLQVGMTLSCTDGAGVGAGVGQFELHSALQLESQKVSQLESHDELQQSLQVPKTQTQSQPESHE